MSRTWCWWCHSREFVREKIMTSLRVGSDFGVSVNLNGSNGNGSNGSSCIYEMTPEVDSSSRDRLEDSSNKSVYMTINDHDSALTDPQHDYVNISGLSRPPSEQFEDLSALDIWQQQLVALVRDFKNCSSPKDVDAFEQRLRSWLAAKAASKKKLSYAEATRYSSIGTVVLRTHRLASASNGSSSPLRLDTAENCSSSNQDSSKECSKVTSSKSTWRQFFSLSRLSKDWSLKISKSRASVALATQAEQESVETSNCPSSSFAQMATLETSSNGHLPGLSSAGAVVSSQVSVNQTSKLKDISRAAVSSSSLSVSNVHQTRGGQCSEARTTSTQTVQPATLSRMSTSRQSLSRDSGNASPPFGLFETGFVDVSKGALNSSKGNVNCSEAGTSRNNNESHYYKVPPTRQPLRQSNTYPLAANCSNSTISVPSFVYGSSSSPGSSKRPSSNSGTVLSLVPPPTPPRPTTLMKVHQLRGVNSSNVRVQEGVEDIAQKEAEPLYYNLSDFSHCRQNSRDDDEDEVFVKSSRVPPSSSKGAKNVQKTSSRAEPFGYDLVPVPVPVAGPRSKLARGQCPAENVHDYDIPKNSTGSDGEGALNGSCPRKPGRQVFV